MDFLLRQDNMLIFLLLQKMKQQSATREIGEEDIEAEVLTQQQQISRVVVEIQTVEQRHQHSGAVAAAAARHEQRRGIETKVY